ncbi:MAG: 2OG-Fe(II) oxygenase family protein [Pseudomonadota bacterium]
MTKIAKIDYCSEQAPQLFVNSLKETGFAVFYNHGIESALLQTVKTQWANFFASDDKLKHLYDKTNIHQNGYYPSESAKGQTVKDLKEFYHIYDDKTLPDNTANSTGELKNKLLTIGLNLLQWLDQYTPNHITANLSKPLSEMVDPHGRTILRALHYPPQDNHHHPEQAIRAAAHNDINLLTILPASDEAGLEAMDNAGNWHTVPCDAGMLIINAGDQLQLCSQGYYQSTLHRVKNPCAERKHLSRYSFPLFLQSHKETVLDIKTGFTTGEYLDQRMRELGII